MTDKDNKNKMINKNKSIKTKDNVMHNFMIGS